MPSIKFKRGAPPQRNGQSGRYKDDDRVALEALYASGAVNDYVDFPFPAKAGRLGAFAFSIGGPGWYSCRTEKKLGAVRVWKIKDTEPAP
jgi:hypothetical protein